MLFNGRNDAIKFVEDYGKQVAFESVESCRKMFKRYELMEVFKNITHNSLSNGFLDVVLYVSCHFCIIDKILLELRSKLPIIGKNKPHLKDISLIVELYLWAPFSNAALDRFFRHMNIIKTGTRNCYLTVVLRIGTTQKIDVPHERNENSTRNVRELSFCSYEGEYLSSDE